jgi:restriction system protein
MKSQLARLNDNEMEKLVAGVLRAMGYRTQVAPESGGDGGIDVLAARDPLFVAPPVIKVQVKQRTGKAAPADIRALAGVLNPDERGIFVSMGGFSGQAKDNMAAARITLIDAAWLRQLLLAYYDRVLQHGQPPLPFLTPSCYQ